MYKLRSVSLFNEDPSRSTKANCLVASANICVQLSSLLYPCRSKCFSFFGVYRNGRAIPPLSIQRNQIYSGLSTRLVGTICLRQTLRASYVIDQCPQIKPYQVQSSDVRHHCFLNSINENKHICPASMWRRFLLRVYYEVPRVPPFFCVCLSVLEQTR